MGESVYHLPRRYYGSAIGDNAGAFPAAGPAAGAGGGPGGGAGGDPQQWWW